MGKDNAMTTLRTMHKRRKRQLFWQHYPCQHGVVIAQADGDRVCAFCDARFPKSYWENLEDDWPEYDDCDDDNGCFHCDGEGWTDAHGEDPINFAEGEMMRCSSCGGSGRAKDMTIW